MVKTSQNEQSPASQRTEHTQAEQLMSFAKNVQPPSSNTDFSHLDKRRIRLDDPPPKPVSVYCLADHQICTAGNLTGVVSQAKMGKTAVLGAFLAAAASPCERDVADIMGYDFLTISAAPHHGRAVVLFDTEQSRYDAWQLVKRAATRAGRGDLPPNFRAYSTADLETAKRRAYLAAELQRASAECGGIHSAFIDGISDLCEDPNDLVEACGLIEELVQLAIKYDCPIIVVLHENPSGTGQEYSKGRGHLGSQLERKAESNLRLVKDSNGVSTIFADRCRRASIPKDMGPRFQWDSSAGMHVSVVCDVKSDKAQEKREAERPAVDAVFDGIDGPISWSELKKLIMAVALCSSDVAEKRIKKWVQLGLIVTSGKGEYRKK
jgi:hypothetical protein